jgi:hypothetical protein
VVITIRARFFEDFRRQVTATEGVRQVVLTAAGLDTRSHRTIPLLDAGFDPAERSCRLVEGFAEGARLSIPGSPVAPQIAARLTAAILAGTPQQTPASAGARLARRNG